MEPTALNGFGPNRARITIDGIQYSGQQKVNQIVPSNFTVYFSFETDTHKGFILNWSCIEWAEWAEWQASDGTCNEEKRPIPNGRDAIGLIKYRTTKLAL